MRNTPDHTDLKGRVALITGGASGIGRGAALKFAQAGACVALVDIMAAELDTAVAEVEGGGAEALALEIDVRDPAAMQSGIDRILARWGRLDIVLANAGINGVWAAADQISPAEYERTMDVNLKGTFFTITAALPALRMRGGAIVITSSVNGTRVFSNSGASVYSASKAGQLALGKMLAMELARDRIRVNVICPGSVTTNINRNTERRAIDTLRHPASASTGVVPLTDDRPASPETVARVLLFLVSDMAAHITGEVIYIDGAQSLLLG